MEILLVISAAVSAIAAAFVANYTRHLSDATKKTARVQEQLADLQRSLAEADMRPLLALSVFGAGRKTKSISNPKRVEMYNLGKYGALVLKLKHHYKEKPRGPDKQGEAVANKARFPRALPSGARDCIDFEDSHPRPDFYYEVIYQSGANNYTYSDLWRYTGGEMGFTRVWHARRVHTPQQPQEIHL